MFTYVTHAINTCLAIYYQTEGLFLMRKGMEGIFFEVFTPKPKISVSLTVTLKNNKVTA